MIVKRIYQKDNTIQWYECDFVIRVPKNEKDLEKFIMYKDKKLIGEIECDPGNGNGFTIFFLENGKTVDTFYWKVNK
ncbi:unnamed protein product [marine sediment metagenome]|uniref:Uncharacterized protein n=1 Tax=marine sediment metagenome TaxID=412755 RepID=X1VG66_9ZZZZ